MTTDLLISKNGGVLALTMNRPASMNAITVAMIARATAEIESAATDPDIRLITLSGAGRAFCAGADIASPDGLPDTSTVDLVNRFALAQRAAPQLVVGLVNGPAAGVGSSFVLGCDLAVAAGSAFIKTGFNAVGLMPDGGGSAYLTATLGRSRALAMAVLGDKVSAAEALRLGIYARVWPDADFDAASGELVRRLASGPSRAFTAAKRAIDDRSLPNFAQALEVERREQRLLLESEDFAEGVRAFSTRRDPEFHGR